MKILSRFGTIILLLLYGLSYPLFYPTFYSIASKHTSNIVCREGGFVGLGENSDVIATKICRERGDSYKSEEPNILLAGKLLYSSMNEKPQDSKQSTTTKKSLQ